MGYFEEKFAMYSMRYNENDFPREHQVERAPDSPVPYQQTPITQTGSKCQVSCSRPPARATAGANALRVAGRKLANTREYPAALPMRDPALFGATRGGL
jgi:hypothetical protein